MSKHSRGFRTVGEAFRNEKSVLAEIGSNEGASIEWCHRCKKFHFVIAKPERIGK